MKLPKEEGVYGGCLLCPLYPLLLKNSLRKHPFLLALRTSPATKSEEKRMFSQASLETVLKSTPGINAAK